MSTTISVFPTVTSVPSYAEVRRVFEINLSSYFASQNLPLVVRAKVDCRMYEESAREFSLDRCSFVSYRECDKIISDPNELLFLLVELDGDKKDRFILDVGENDQTYVEEILELDSEAFKGGVPNIFWTSTILAGASALTRIGYGIFVASIAELVGGLIFSGDCAWESIFPCDSTEFLRNYMIPEMASEKSFKELALNDAERVRHKLQL